MYRENKLSETECRLPTTSEEILGIFLNDPLLLKEYKRKLSPGMFTTHLWLYTEMLILEEQGALSYKALIKLFPQHGPALHELRETVASNARLPYLIEKLKKEHLSNELHQINQSALEQTHRDPNELLSEMQSRINGLSNTEATELHDSGQDVDNFYGWLDEIMDDPGKAYGMMTDIEELDRLTTGFHRGDFIVIGARTSIGKSAFMIELALRFAKKGTKVGIYSLEMSKKQMYLRMLSNLMTLDLELIKTGRMVRARVEERNKHKEFLKRIYVDDTRGISADYITDSMRRMKRTRGLDVTMVDYLQDVKENGESNDNGGSAIARVCRKLRKGAQEVDCVMFGLSQVTRDVENRKDKRPMVSDLAGSTGIETSADGIALLYRDDYYDSQTDKRGIMEVNFAKQRNGDVGKVELYYDRKCQQIRSLSAGRY